MAGPRPRGRGVETCVSTLVAATACAAVWLFDHGTDGPAPPQPAAEAAFAPEAAPSPSASTAQRSADHESGPRASAPLRVDIPSISVRAPLTRLGLTPDGRLQAPPPQDANLAGWYADGTPPGAVGTALIAGHVDNADGPAVFYGLGALRKGAAVEVPRRDGFTAVFTVDAVEVYEGPGFPDEKVYGPADRPELRLITCGGTFDEEAGAYTGNVVVFAHLTDVLWTDDGRRDGGGAETDG